MKSKMFLPQTMWRLADADEGDIIKVLGSWNDATEDFELDVEYEVVVNEECNRTRWNAIYDLVFLDIQNNIHYHTTYERGLTENNYTTPFCHETDGVQCYEVSVTREEVITYRTLWKYI